MFRRIVRPLRGESGVTLTELIVTIALFAIVMLGVVGIWTKAQEAYFVGSEAAEVQQNARAAIDFMVRELRAVGRDVTVCAFDYATSATTDCTGAKVTGCTPKTASTYPGSNGAGGTGCQSVFAIPFAEATATSIRIRSDRNDSGTIAGMGNAVPSGAGADRGEENVIYALSTSSCPPGVPQCITRDDGTGPVAMVAVDISGFTLTYYPRPDFGPCAGVANPCNNAFTPPLADQNEADNIAKIRMVVTALQTTAGQTVSRTLTTDIVLMNRR